MALTEVAPRVHRLGTSLVNWYLVEEERGLTVVDAGLPAHRPQLDEAVSALGCTVSDVHAVILTHPHADHIGIAESLHADGVPVLVHELDEQLARSGEQPKRERSLLPYLRRPAALRLVWELGRGGGIRPRWLSEVSLFRDGDVLELPGRPQVLHTPGHTLGHCAFHLHEHDVLFVGDALCELNPLTGRRGPQVMPAALNAGSAQALESLERIERLEVGTLLFGHGEPWRDGAAAAVASARELGTS